MKQLGLSMGQRNRVTRWTAQCPETPSTEPAEAKAAAQEGVASGSAQDQPSATPAAGAPAAEAESGFLSSMAGSISSIFSGDAGGTRAPGAPRRAALPPLYSAESTAAWEQQGYSKTYSHFDPVVRPRGARGPK